MHSLFKITVTLFLSSILSSQAFSQAEISFLECNKAVKNLSHYIAAAVDQVGVQLLSSEVTEAEHEYRVQELIDFKQTHTLHHCMDGENTAVFQCILSESSAYEECRSGIS